MYCSSPRLEKIDLFIVPSDGNRLFITMFEKIQIIRLLNKQNMAYAVQDKTAKTVLIAAVLSVYKNFVADEHLEWKKK